MTATENPSTATVKGSLPVLTGGDPEVASVTEKVPEAFDLSIPKVGAYRTESHDYYWNGKGPQPNVTSILDVMQKWGIYYGGLKKVSTAAVNRWEEIGALLMGNAVTAANTLFPGPITQTEIGSIGDPYSLLRKHAVQRWLAKIPDQERDIAAQMGTGVHTLSELVDAGTGFEPSPEELPFIESYRGFLAFLEAHRGTIVSSEKYVWSEDGYAGTYDRLIRFECDCHQGLWLVDLKTSATGPYPEWALQLIAYANADWIIVPDNPMGYPMPLIQRYGVLHLRPDLYTDNGWRLIEYPLDPVSDYMAFLGALELYKWKEQKRYTKSILNRK